MSNSINSNEQHYKNPSSRAIIGSIVAGSAVKGLIETPTHIIAPIIMKQMQKISDSLSQDEFKQVENAVIDTVEKSGLGAKGVNIINATAENADNVTKILQKEIDNGILRHLPQKVKKIIRNMFSQQFLTGNNACYAPSSKKIIMPEKKLGLAFFHEAGHAMNDNLSKLGRILQKSRSMVILALPITLIALLKTKKAPGEKPKNSLDKVTTFVKNNAGKLTFAAFIPMLIEEGLATLKGNKFAKKLLSPELAKKVAKTNALGFSTYLMLATLSSLGIYLGTKVKDSIAPKTLVAENK